MMGLRQLFASLDNSYFWTLELYQLAEKNHKAHVKIAPICFIFQMLSCYHKDVQTIGIWESKRGGLTLVLPSPLTVIQLLNVT